MPIPCLQMGHICTRKVAVSPSVPYQLFSGYRIKQFLSGCEAEGDWLIITSKRASHKGLSCPSSLPKIFSDLESWRRIWEWLITFGRIWDQNLDFCVCNLSFNSYFGNILLLSWVSSNQLFSASSVACVKSFLSSIWLQLCQTLDS